MAFAMGAAKIFPAFAHDDASRPRVSSLLEAKARRFVHNEAGASAAEYALILGLIAAVIVGSLGTLVNAVANGILSPVNGFTAS
jgi:Flp pilus assembly pilin Flp